MPLVNKDQIIAFKRVHRDRLVSRRFSELVYVDDVDATTLKFKTHRGVFVEQRRLDSGKFEFLLMLSRQALIRSQKDDSVQIFEYVRFSRVVQVLSDMTVHQQRLAAARSHPKGYFVEIVFRERLNLGQGSFLAPASSHNA